MGLGARVGSALTSIMPSAFAARRAENRARIVRAETRAALADVRKVENRERIFRSEFRQRLLEGAAQEFAGFRGYLGASKEAPYGSWTPLSGSADADLLDDLPTLRARTRDLERSDPHAAAVIDAWVNQVIGTGLWPQSRIDHEVIGISAEQARTFEKSAERLYKRWARAADVSRRLTAPEVQALIFRQIVVNGDVFVLPRFTPRARMVSQLAVETIEADRVTTPARKQGDLSIREGVRVGADGVPRAYFIKKTHPGEVMNPQIDDFVEVAPATSSGRPQVIHLYQMRRPGQTRGIPFLSPALSYFKDLQQYFRAELVAAKVSACIAILVEMESPLGEIQASTRQDGEERLRTMYPGMIEYLRAGEKVSGFNPQRPNTAFDSFVMRILRAAGASNGIPYEIVSQDFSQTTYTSGRMALTEVRRLFRSWQRWLADHFCTPFWELLIEEAVLAGELDAPDFEEFRDEYLRAFWVGQGWSWVDPQKEVTATADAIAANLSTLQDELSARGIDWEEGLEQRAREMDLIEKLGLQPGPQAPASAPPGGTDDDTEEPEDGEEEDDE